MQAVCRTHTHTHLSNFASKEAGQTAKKASSNCNELPSCFGGRSTASAGFSARSMRTTCTPYQSATAVWQYFYMYRHTYSELFCCSGSHCWSTFAQRPARNSNRLPSALKPSQGRGPGRGGGGGPGFTQVPRQLVAEGVVFRRFRLSSCLGCREGAEVGPGLPRGACKRSSPGVPKLASSRSVFNPFSRL